MFAEAGMNVAYQGSSLRTPDRGFFRKGNFVLYQTAPEQPNGLIPWEAGVITHIFEATAGAETHFLAMVVVHEMLANAEGFRPHADAWRRRQLVHGERLRHRLASFADGHLVRVVFPTDWQIHLK